MTHATFRERAFHRLPLFALLTLVAFALGSAAFFARAAASNSAASCLRECCPAAVASTMGLRLVDAAAELSPESCCGVAARRDEFRPTVIHAAPASPVDHPQSDSCCTCSHGAASRSDLDVLAGSGPQPTDHLTAAFAPAATIAAAAPPDAPSPACEAETRPRAAAARSEFSARVLPLLI